MRRWPDPSSGVAPWLGLGLLLIPAGSTIIIVLVHLGLLTWAAALLARCPSWLVATLGVGSLAASPLLLEALAPLDARLTTTGPHALSLLLDLTATGDTYRLSSMLAWAAFGLLAARTLVPTPGGARPALVGLTAIAAGILVLAVAGRPVPYAGSLPEIAVSALLALGVLLLGLGLTRLAGGRGPAWLADLGRMTLSLYVLHVLALAALLRWVRPGGLPHGWDVLAALVAGSLVLAVGWNRLPSTRRWGRGPVEGLVERVVDLVAGRGVGPRRVS